MIRRIILAVLAVVVVAALVAAGVAYRFLSGDGIRRALERQASAWLGQPVHIQSATAQFYPRPGVALGNVTVGEPASLTLATIGISTDLRALIDRRIENAEVVVSNSRIQMPLPFTRRPAPSGGGADDDPIRLVSVRSILLRDVRLLSRGHEILVDADSALDGSRLTVRRFDAQTGNTRLEAEGIVELTPRVDATVRVNANTLDVDELLALAHAFIPAGGTSARGAGLPPRIAARVSSERARAGGLEVTQFAAGLQMDGNQVSLSPLTFQLFGGRYQGSLNAQLGGGVQATLESRIIDIDVAQLAAFGGVPDAVTGTMTGAGTFTGRGADLAEVLRGARGEGTASVVKGTIQRLNLIRTVVLFFGRPAPGQPPASDRFERIDLSFSLANRIFRANAFALQSADADIVGSGTLNVATKALEGHMDLSLSEALSAQAGTDLRRFTREGNRVVLPARLGGTLGQPRLGIDPGAAVQRGLENEIKRRLGGLLEGLGK